MSHAELLQLVKSRKRAGHFGYGIGLASWAFAQAAQCGGDRECLKSVLKQSLRSFSIDNALKAASKKLAFCNPAFTEVKVAASSGGFASLLPEGVQAPPNTLMIVRHTLTTPREDRDKDVLQTRGAMVDPILPLLWQHIHTLPIGRAVATIQHDEHALKIASAIIDVNELAHDAAILFEAGVLRFSHGFRALEFSQRKVSGDPDPGFEVTKFEIMEESAVSVPSNIDAQVEAWSKGQLKSELVKRVSEEAWRSRPVSTPGAEFEPSTLIRIPSVGGEFLPISDVHIGQHPIVMPVKGNLSQEQIKSITDGGFALTKFTTEGEYVFEKQPACGCETKMQGAGGPVSTTLVGEPRLVAQPPAFEQEPKRWSKNAGSRFEVELEHVEASTLEYDWVAKHLRCQVKQVFQNSEFIPSAKMGSFLTALEQMSRDMDQVDVRNLTPDEKGLSREKPPVYEVVQLNSEKSNSFLVDGLKFMRAKLPGGVDFVYKFKPSWYGINVTIYSAEEQRMANALQFVKCWEWFRLHNFLKGEAFSISGDFLPRDEETWGDVFLEKENIEPLKKAVESLNKYGADSVKRGMLLMGPPGTGKTLAGRIIKNEADATFIWISARDFYYMGAFGGLSYGFDMAKLLAPSVLFIEDVDNWLGSYEIDFLKTEMDGIAKTKGVTTILTTNFPEKLPKALIDRPGRFHDVLKFDLPSDQVRAAMLRKWLPDLDDAARELAVKESTGWSGAHVYHLAEFAKTLRSEEETISAAVTKAVAKIRDQREMIDNLQVSGSRYKGDRAVSAWRPLATVTSLIPRQNGEIISVKSKFDRTIDEYGIHSGYVQTMFADKVVAAKAGRTLSKANENHCTEAMEDLMEAMKMEMARGAKTLCKSAAGHIESVLKSMPEAKPEDDEDEDSDPEEGEVEEKADPVMLASPKQAVRLLIENATHEDRVWAAKRLAAVIQAEDAHIHAEEVLNLFKV